MSYLENLKNEWRFWPNPETMSLQTRRASGNAFHDLENAVQRMDLAKASAAFGGVEITTNEVAFILPVALIENEQVRTGDRLYEALEDDVEEDTDFWIVQRSQLVRFNTQWTVTAVRNQ